MRSLDLETKRSFADNRIFSNKRSCFSADDRKLSDRIVYLQAWSWTKARSYIWHDRALTYSTSDLRSNLKAESATKSPWLTVTAPASSWNGSNLHVNLTCSIWEIAFAVSTALSLSLKKSNDLIRWPISDGWTQT